MPPSTVLCCFTLVIPSACLPIKSGLPARILSSREIRLTAPDFVLGGKNSREKNLSLLSHLSNNYQTQVDIFFPIPPGIDLLCKGGSKTVHVDWGGWSGAVDKGIGSRKEGKKYWRWIMLDFNPSSFKVATYGKKEWGRRDGKGKLGEAPNWGPGSTLPALKPKPSLKNEMVQFSFLFISQLQGWQFSDKVEQRTADCLQVCNPHNPPIFCGQLVTIIFFFLFWLDWFEHTWFGSQNCWRFFTWWGWNRGSLPARHNQGWSSQCGPESSLSKWWYHIDYQSWLNQLITYMNIHTYC